jgi:hypothetical protein
MPVNVRPTRADREIARVIARNTTPATEETVLTWGADEHVLCAAAAVWWLYCRGRPAPERAASNHILITTIAATTGRIPAGALGERCRGRTCTRHGARTCHSAVPGLRPP